MTKDQQQEQASLYVLGALSAEEAQAFEVALRSDAELRALVRGLQRTAGLVAMASPQVAAPAELKEKVLRRVEGVSPKKRPALLAGFNFVGADNRKGWKELPVRGAWIKLLSIERERGYAVLLGRLEPGVRYPAHEHLAAEEIYILTGDLNIGDRSLGPGDFHHADAGTSHGVNYSVEGCTLLAVLPAEHELVQFAMA
jgi:anti-sigma factor ChrR (cupin superfamily)